jgi:hypothetical protein
LLPRSGAMKIRSQEFKREREWGHPSALRSVSVNVAGALLPKSASFPIFILFLYSGPKSCFAW